MAEFHVRHEFDCAEDTFWEKVMFDPDFNRRLYKEELKFPDWKVLEQKDDGKTIRRKVHIDPPVTGLPGPVKKAVGDKFSYVEDGVYDRATRTYTFHVTPSAMAEKTKTTGTLKTEKLGDKKCARLADIKVDVKVFMIGGMVEDWIIGDLKSSYEAAAKFTRTYLQEKGL